nr:hypothetical protein [Tanacetum cinerariifolium]
MLFTINPRHRPTVNANSIIESIPSPLIPIQDNESQREEIDIVTSTDELLPLGFEKNDSEEEIDAVEELHVDNSISNSANKLSNNESSGSNFDNLIYPSLIEVKEKQENDKIGTKPDKNGKRGKGWQCNFLDKIPRDGLSIIESKSKVRYSRSRVTDSRVSTNTPLSSSSPSNSFDLQQIAVSLEDKLDIRMNLFEKSLNDMKAFVSSPAPIKAVEEFCVTCGANHSYNHFPLTRGGNEFSIFHENIQQFQTAAVGNFVQGNRH